MNTKVEEALADHEPRDVGPGNYYGSLSVMVREGNPYWAVENWDGYCWEICPRPVYYALITALNQGEGK